MKIIEKYLLKSFMGPFLWCLLIFIFLYIVIDLFENLDDILKSFTPGLVLLQYYLTAIPEILINIMPLAVLLSIIYALSKLNKQNEITAMRASGISIFEIFKPFIIVGAFISVIALSMNLNLVPQTNRMHENLKNTYLTSAHKKQTDKIIENLTVYGHSDRIIYAKKFDPSVNTLYDVIILKEYRNRLIERITAEKIIWDQNQWNMINSMTYYMRADGEIFGSPRFFSEEVIHLEEEPEDFLKSYTDASFMKYSELRNHIEKFRGSSNKIIRRLSIELYKKPAVAFVNIIMILIAIPFALKLNYTGTFMSIGICIGIGFCYYAINAISIALGNAGILPAFVSVWLTNFIFALIGIILLFYLKN